VAGKEACLGGDGGRGVGEVGERTEQLAGERERRSWSAPEEAEHSWSIEN